MPVSNSFWRDDWIKHWKCVGTPDSHGELLPLGVALLTVLQMEKMALRSQWEIRVDLYGNDDHGSWHVF
jgi:hypothetical protein